MITRAWVGCSWSPGLPYASEKPGSWQCPSASLVQSHLARWGAPEQKSTLRLKVHQGKISPRYLSCERKNVTGGTSILALKSKWVSCWETCGILGPREGSPGARLAESRGKTLALFLHIHQLRVYSFRFLKLNIYLFQISLGEGTTPILPIRKAQIEKPTDVLSEPIMDFCLICPHLGF